MDLKDQFRYLVGGYFGITYMDEYPLKEFVLKDIENYIRDFIEINPIDDFDYVLESEKSVMQMEGFRLPNCSVAVCGSNFNKYQLNILMKNLDETHEFLLHS